MGLIHRLSARNKDSQIEYSDDGITNISDDIPKETTIVDEDEIVAEGIELTHDSVDEKKEGYSSLENSFLKIYSWDYIPNVFAAKHVDKSALKYGGSALPEGIFPFFHAENILPGKSKALFLRYDGKEYVLNIKRGKTNPKYTFENVRIFWDKPFGFILRDYCAENNNKGVKIVFKPGLDEIHYDVTLEIETEASNGDLSENDKSEYGNVSDGGENVVEESENIYENMPIEDDFEEQDEEDEGSANLDNDLEWKEDTPENARFVCGVLRHNFKLLGIDNERAKLYSALIVYGPQSFSTLIQCTNSINGHYRKRLWDSLIACCESKEISMQTKYNSTNKPVNYYILDTPTQTIYKNLHEENKKLIVFLTDTLKIIEKNIHSLSKDKDKGYNMAFIMSQSKYSELVSNVINLGLTQEVATLMTFLSIFPHTPIKVIELKLGVDLHSSSSANIIRELCHYDWIQEEYTKNKLNREYSLRMPFYDILLKYVIDYGERIENALEATKEILDYIDNNPNVYKNLEISTKFSKGDTVDPALQKSPYYYFIENTKEITEQYNESEDGSFIFYMKHPLPKIIRVYHYFVMPASKPEGYSKIRLYIKGNSHKQSVLNFTNADFVIVAGYEPKLNMFIFWNAYLYKGGFNGTKTLHVENSIIYLAKVNGIAEITQKSKAKNKPNEHIIAVTQDNIHKGIIKQYEYYVNDLIRGKL